MTPAPDADVASVREHAIHYLDGDIITGASGIHSEDCPGCKLEAALDRLAARLQAPKNAVEWMLVVKDERDRAEAAEAREKALREAIEEHLSHPGTEYANLKHAGLRAALASDESGEA